MQRIIPDSSRRRVPDDDARLVGSESELPSVVLLDFIYGAAAYQRWKTDETVDSKLNSYCSEKYEKILSPKGPKLVPIESSGSEEVDISNGNSDDPDWREGMPGMLDAMDKVMDISWKVRLRTMPVPEKVVARLQKEEEEEELREQEATRMKVLGWMGRTETSSFPNNE